MKGFLPIFLGILGTFAFSWVGLTMIPNAQIGYLEPQMDEEGTDIYPVPKSGMAERGREVYIANGCQYCHSQQVRPDYAAADIDRKWGERRSAPRDYIFERPVLLGKMRMGPDLSNVGKRAPVEEAAPSPAAAEASPAPSPEATPPAAAPAAPILNPPYTAEWHHRHLYAPRSITLNSNMPAFRYLYEKREITGEPAADALRLTGATAPPQGWEIVPTYDAQCLVAYLISLDQSHPLNEVKSTAPVAASPSPAAAAPAPASK